MLLSTKKQDRFERATPEPYTCECPCDICQAPQAHVRRLVVLGACGSGLDHAIKFPTMFEAWNACARIDYMVWCLVALGYNAHWPADADTRYTTPDEFRALNPCPAEYDAPVKGSAVPEAVALVRAQAEPRRAPRRARKKSPAVRKVATAAASSSAKSTRKGAAKSPAKATRKAAVRRAGS